MKRRNMLTLGTLFLGGVLSAAWLATTQTADSAIEAKVSVASPPTVACGSRAQLVVSLDTLDSRKSRLANDVGMGAFSVTVTYPGNALREVSAASGPVLPVDAPTADGATGRQWIAGPNIDDVGRGLVMVGAFSYVGAPNPMGRLGRVDVSAPAAAREAAGVAPRERPLPLAVIELDTGAVGAHTVRVDVELVDSSVDSLAYLTQLTVTTINVGPGDCARLDPIPMATVNSSSQPPPVTDLATIPTPDRYPNDIPPPGDLGNVIDGCETDAPVVTRFMNRKLCLPTGWTITVDPSADEIEAAIRAGEATGAGTRALAEAYTVIDALDERGDTLARISTTLVGQEPSGFTRCAEPARIEGVGTACFHEAKDGPSHLAPGTWRILGITTESGNWVTIEIFSGADQPALQQVERSALGVVRSMQEVQ